MSIWVVLPFFLNSDSCQAIVPIGSSKSEQISRIDFVHIPLFTNTHEIFNIHKILLNGALIPGKLLKRCTSTIVYKYLEYIEQV